MDHFREEVVTKRNRAVESVLYALSFVVMIVSGLITVFMFNLLTMAISTQGFSSGMIMDIVFTVLMAATAVLLFLYKDRIKTEYEYTFTNGTMDFARVFNNKKRKSLGTMNIKNIEACGKVSSGSFHRYLSMPGVRRLNWFLNRDAELFYFYFVKDSAKSLMIIEPSDEMVQLIIRYAGQGKYQQN
ncbi:MAG: hypothetical protein ACOX58_00885 [Christensenellales bacterium]|jgi:hypothetical protein